MSPTPATSRRVSTGRVELISPTLADRNVDEFFFHPDDFCDIGVRRRSGMPGSPTGITFTEPRQLVEQDKQCTEEDPWIEAAGDLEVRASLADSRSSSISDHFMVDEEILQGRVSMSAYLSYLWDRGWLPSLLSILSYVTFLGIQAFGNYWIQWFADDRDLAALEKQVNNDTIWSNATERDRILREVGNQTLHYISGYSWIGLAQLFAMLCYLICHAIAWIRASKVMHHNLLKRMLHAPAALFDRTPLGRILNRFSNDIENVDRTVPDALSEVITCVGDLSICLIVVLISLKPPGMGLVIVIPLMIICGIIQSLYVPCSRQVRRLDAVTRSPLLANFGETAASTLGCSVMRAFGRTAAFVEHADELIDRNAVHGYVRFASNRWLDVTLTVDQEGNWECGPDSPPPPDWPAPCCEVRFNRASMLYTLPGPEKDNTSVETPSPFLGSDEPALRSVDLVLSGNRETRRIGVVGRTGAGKSSLASSIFRLNEAVILEEDRATLSGSLANLGPEPVLFAGTLRFNLDPFGVQPEERLWAALEASHLASWAGQRQLVCLARVCLSSGGRVRLLILDEATAAMDPYCGQSIPKPKSVRHPCASLMIQIAIDGISPSILNTSTALNVHTRILYLIVKCSNNIGGMNVRPAKLEVDREPIFLKRQAIPYGRLEGVLEALEKTKRDGIITRVTSSAWATPIVIASQNDRKTLRITGKPSTSCYERVRLPP
ncbi:unnamed protein product [Echinostoma caproni]|uniref:ABC transmembrane type-1 domain-containing protein n=1 Tax=Echinostoma caproni TaxID=27848 RepID=A0A3P8K299_9TREM|nr:unnamed protein product [Echinostoma caproni]